MNSRNAAAVELHPQSYATEVTSWANSERVCCERTAEWVDHDVIFVLVALENLRKIKLIVKLIDKLAYIAVFS